MFIYSLVILKAVCGDIQALYNPSLSVGDAKEVGEIPGGYD